MKEREEVNHDKLSLLKNVFRGSYTVCIGITH